MLTWFQAGLLYGKNPYLVDFDGRLHQAAADHFLFCEGEKTNQDYEDFCAGVEAYEELHGFH